LGEGVVLLPAPRVQVNNLQVAAQRVNSLHGAYGQHRRFSRPRFCLGNDIPARHNGPDGALLNGRWTFKADFKNRALQILLQAHAVKSSDGLDVRRSVAVQSCRFAAQCCS
jgi:hypothetical protein